MEERECPGQERCGGGGLKILPTLNEIRKRLSERKISSSLLSKCVDSPFSTLGHTTANLQQLIARYFPKLLCNFSTGDSSSNIINIVISIIKISEQKLINQKPHQLKMKSTLVLKKSKVCFINNEICFD